MMTAMEFRHELRYDAPPGRVHAMLTDPAFRERVCAAVHALDHSVAVDRDGDTTTVVVDQAQPTADAPAFAARLVGDRVRIVQTETWSGPGGGRLEVAVPGKPAGMTGEIRLRPEPRGTVETVTGRVSVRVPLLSGRLESLVAGLLRDALDAEHEVGVAWLAAAR